MNCDSEIELDGQKQNLGDLLLTPTLIYTQPVRQVLSHYKVKNVVHGIAHITGGGLAENIERILPAGVQIEIQADSWKRPPIFDWLQKTGNVEHDEMMRVFNMGLGLCLIVSSYYADSIRRMFTEQGFDNWTIGSVTDVIEGDAKVTLQ